ncbi:amino acid/amide ABC transporter ATP-binding protein 2, HAAT family [Variovorax sp. YR266]|uniref:ABC transporter ATP-binding protein n=1 Tax=Variovorax sp. YR266 TaxID=1884386 RepID=UPI0008955ABE|nr:ABC transporter ATP-binding protein [Variovorax sp. YR266]SDY34200.1 amino acid/amide ABC transporter ATP-binding protein 2, HAAT family [Variovorax sp. YR266]
MTALLEVNNLCASYRGNRVLHGLDLRIETASIVTLLGANGAGKTTTLRALCHMVDSAGEVRFNGENISRLPTEKIVRLGIAHVPDGRGTFTGLSAEENLQLGSYVRKDKAEVALDRERVYAYFPRLKERRKQQAGTLSGGEQQMLAIGRALMLRPKLLLLDEPSFGLAPLVVQEIFEIMRLIREKEGMSILLVEQNAAIALELADYAYLIETGRLVLSGESGEVKRNDAVRRSYLGE